jgi:hypothetical protein
VEIREPTPPPQTEVAVKATLEEATLVEGMYTSQLVGIKLSHPEILKFQDVNRKKL